VTNPNLLDLDARRAQVREAKGEFVAIRIGGIDFKAPTELPVTFAYYMTQMEIEKAVQSLFGDQADDFLALGPTVPDLEAIVSHYGVSLGEAKGQPPSLSSIPAN
jgi:hypothetical protein